MQHQEHKTQSNYGDADKLAIYAPNGIIKNAISMSDKLYRELQESEGITFQTMNVREAQMLLCRMANSEPPHAPEIVEQMRILEQAIRRHILLQ